MQIVLDVNILVSIAIDTLKPISTAWRALEFTVLSSEELVIELEDVLPRKKLQKYLTTEKIDLFLQEFEILSKPIYIEEPFPEFIDPKDRYILAMLEHEEVELLVTSDKALLRLETHTGKNIIHPSDFVRGYLI